LPPARSILPIALALLIAGYVVSVIMTFLAKRTAQRLHLMDAPGHRKVHTTPTPRNGGIGIFWGIALPLLAGLIVIAALHPTVPLNADPNAPLSTFDRYLPGLKSHLPLAALLLVTTFGIHLVGLLDDRITMRPWPKLLAQLFIAAALVILGEIIQPGGFRTLTLLDDALPLGREISMAISILWIVALTNAFNFLDNMDGLSAGVAAIAAAMFLIAAILSGQWFICGLLLLFIGSVLGFLTYNFPPASIFMGDGGSMVLGFFLSALTIRTTYYTENVSHWYTIFAPLIILAVPLYDMTIVSIMRIRRGYSPMTGDTNHFSHRLTRHGFSKRGAVLVIYCVTLAMGISAPLLAKVDDLGAILIAIQSLAILIVIGILERIGEHLA
jgi:UDP-GlcNAc:undecaprenyl-phosphate GlcNAc-1-phosphate transferase